MITARQMEAYLEDPYGNPETKSHAADIMATLLGLLKALYWQHWTAHWQTAGCYADHLLFERLKDAVEAEIDPLAEKIVGYYGANIVDAAHVMEHEHEGMAPENARDDLIGTALTMERGFQQYLAAAYDTLKGLKMLPMGLDDYLQSVANTHDAHVYLLQQRKGGKRGSKQAMDSLEKSWMGHSTFAPMRNALNDDEVEGCEHLELEWVGYIDPDDPEAI